MLKRSHMQTEGRTKSVELHTLLHYKTYFMPLICQDVIHIYIFANESELDWSVCIYIKPILCSRIIGHEPATTYLVPSYMYMCIRLTQHTKQGRQNLKETSDRI